MSNKRRRYSATEKMAALRQHFIDAIPVSDICEELGIAPSLFYDWQRVLFSRPPQVFHQKTEKGMTSHRQEIARLEQKLQQKDEVLAEVLVEYITLKKKSGAR
jgi:transposase